MLYCTMPRSVFTFNTNQWKKGKKKTTTAHTLSERKLWMNEWIKSFKEIAFHRINVCLFERFILYEHPGCLQKLHNTNIHINGLYQKIFSIRPFWVEICIHASYTINNMYIYNSIQQPIRLVADIRNSSKVIQNKSVVTISVYLLTFIICLDAYRWYYVASVSYCCLQS